MRRRATRKTLARIRGLYDCYLLIHIFDNLLTAFDDPDKPTNQRADSNMNMYCPRDVLSYMAYTGTCGWIGYGFWPLCPKPGIQFKADPS